MSPIDRLIDRLIDPRINQSINQSIKFLTCPKQRTAISRRTRKYTQFAKQYI